MPVRYLILLLSLSSTAINAEQRANDEQEIDIFEFLAMFEQQDDDYLDSEIFDAEVYNKQHSLNEQTEKSMSDEE